ncbi:MAG: hypothetical protein IKH84_02080 [Ottowia sp.]|nr:hypothetical protein [Ottowia sp.]
MAVWALGLNHTTAPVDLRGRFAFALDQIAPDAALAERTARAIANALEAAVA